MTSALDEGHRGRVFNTFSMNPFYYQLMHITLKNAELLKHSKLDKKRSMFRFT